MSLYKILLLLMCSIALVSCDWQTTAPEQTHTLKAPVFSPEPGEYSLGQQITLSCPTDSVQIRYTTDGTEPVAESALYSTPLTIPDIFINNSNEVLIKAKAFKSGYWNSNTTSASYNIHYSYTVATPVISPAGGTYQYEVPVTITCSTNGAQIRYTTDGTEPTYFSELYTNQITLKNPVIKARAFKANYNSSGTASRTYSIKIYLSGVFDTAGEVNDIVIVNNSAYLADGWGGMRILDISNPMLIKEIGFATTPGFAYEIAIKDNFAYVACGSSGLQIIDIHNPYFPFTVSSLPSYGMVKGISINGELVLLANSEGGVRIIDISDPIHPIETGQNTSVGNVSGVSTLDTYAYTTNTYSGLGIIDIRDSSQPDLIGFYDTPGSAYEVVFKEHYALIADGFAGLSILDITNPAAPFETSNCNTPNIATGIAVRNNYAYIVDGVGGGLRIFDISNYSFPTEAGHLDVTGDARTIAVKGFYAYIASGEEGLKIIHCHL